MVDHSWFIRDAFSLCVRLNKNVACPNVVEGWLKRDCPHVQRPGGSWGRFLLPLNELLMRVS